MPRVLGFVTCLGLFLACGGGESSPAVLLFGATEGLVERRLDTGEQLVLIPSPAAQHTLRDPAISPDGTRLVYVSAPPLRRVQGVLDASTDVWIANRDGSDARMLYERSKLAEAASSPRWLDDSNILFILRNIIDPANPAGGATYRLVRLDVERGSLATVVEQVFVFDISPDGSKIAYLQIEDAREQPLYIANSDGSAAVRRLDSAGSGLEAFSALAFTDDGESVLLAAHPAEGAVGSSQAAPHAASLLHTAPLDLYLVPIGEGEPTLAAAAQTEGPGVDAAGGLAYLLAGKLLEADLASGTVTTLSEPGTYGGVLHVAP